MHVLFLSDFDWSPPAYGGRVTTAYKGGYEGSVTHDCAAAAIASGRAVGVDPPSREEGQRQSGKPLTGGAYGRDGKPKRPPATKK